MPAIVTVEKSMPPHEATAGRQRIALDPARATTCTSPIVALAESWLGGTGIEHDHRGVEGVLIVLDGAVAHADSIGGERVARAGDVTWLTAGRGVAHRAGADGDREAHLLELWARLPLAEADRPPACHDLAASRVPQIDAAGVRVRVIAGSHAGVPGPVTTSSRIALLELVLDAGAATSLELADVRGVAYVVAGAACIAGAAVGTGDVAFLDVRGVVPIEIDSVLGARLVVATAPPAGGPADIAGAPCPV